MFSGVQETQADIDKFLAKVLRGDGCWEWRGARFTSGYGVFSIGHKTVKAHRFSWYLENGPIPQGMFICHTCDNPPCVRPSHLFMGTNTDNLQDAIRKGRVVFPLPQCPPERRARGERAHKAKLTADKVVEIRKQSALGRLHKDIAADFGVSDANIAYIVMRKTWKHVP